MTQELHFGVVYSPALFSRSSSEQQITCTHYGTFTKRVADTELTDAPLSPNPNELNINIVSLDLGTYVLFLPREYNRLTL